MSKIPSKVLFLGIDSPVASAIYKWAKEGKLPNLQKLIDRGVFCQNGLVPFPTITPPNWTSIATGAWPGTHGVTDFDVHVPGTALDETHQGFDSSDIDAETLWEAGERVGKKSIVVNWPTSWPKRMKDGYQIAGYGLSITDWRQGIPIEDLTATMLAHDVLLSTEYYPRHSEVVWKQAGGWDGVEHGPQALEAEVQVNLWRPKVAVKPIVWNVLVDKSASGAFDTVVIARSKSKDGVYCRLKVGEWSQNVYDSFETEQGDKKAVMRFKLLELSPDAQQFRVYCPGIFALNGWGFPAELEQEITSENGLPTARTAYEPFLMEWIDGQTLVETYDLHHQWLVDATKTMFQKPWDMYFLHIHTIDWIYHTFSVELEPLLAQDKSLIAHYQDIELKLHQGVDWCIGQIVEAAGDDTLVVIMSDHGVKARGQKFDVGDILEKAGLLHYLPAAEEGKARQIDWSKTKAVSQRTVHIYVNTKGRDPQGIVEPGEEYEQVREQVIKALYEYADPKTGAHPIALALKNEDARIIGLWGPRAGDVIYAEDPRFGKEHGPYLTTNRYGYGDLRGLIIFAGPGIKQGEVIDRNVWLTDIVPTVCHVAELPVPNKCDGTVVYQALEDPDAQVKELQSLRRNVDRLKRMVERPPMC
ncbi:MAG: alkaline phosphatase family protein [Chloroflexota bacterium]